MSRPATESNHQQGAPTRDDSSGPDSPTDLSRASWVYVVRKTVREFSGTSAPNGTRNDELPHPER
jgi:hypothetical protein